MSNDFIPFAVGGSANVITQSAYAALTSITQNGFQSGISQSNQLNKVWRQSSIMSAVLAQFIVDQSGQNAVDDGTTATLETNLIAAIRNAAKQAVILTDTGVANAYTATNTPALTVLPGTGYTQRVNIAHANTGASTYAPDGLTAKPIYGLGLQPLQGGELPVGIVILMYLVQAGVNSGNGAWIIIESLGGAQQVAPATQSQHAVQLGQVAGVVGSVRNLVMSITAASASATLTADEIVVETALGGLRYCLASFNQTINLATTGAGGMDTGSAPVSGYVALYAIYNPTTQTAKLLATNATSAAVNNVYGGGSMPAGYTASALVSVWPTNASSQFTPGFQIDRAFTYLNAVTVLNVSTTASSPTTVTTTAVPYNAKTMNGSVDASTSSVSAGAGSLSLYATSTSTSPYYALVGYVSSGIYIESPYAALPLLTPRTFYYQNAAPTTPGAAITCAGYTI